LKDEFGMCELQVRLCDEITTSRCDCCGDVSRRVWGEVQAAGTTVAVYFVHWTVGHVFDYGAHFDLILARGATTPVPQIAASFDYTIASTNPA
jgi:hypothetical protein